MIQFSLSCSVVHWVRAETEKWKDFKKALIYIRKFWNAFIEKKFAIVTKRENTIWATRYYTVNTLAKYCMQYKWTSSLLTFNKSDASIAYSYLNVEFNDQRHYI